MGNTGLAVTEKKETRLAHPLEFSTEQIRILAETVAKGCDQNELAFFLNVCKLKRLDPFTGQVHCVKRWDSTLGREKMSIQVGIDGFRVIAVRSGELAGISDPEFDSEDEQRPEWARVTVYRYGRDNEKIAYPAKARFSEYMQTKKDGSPNIMWATKPYIMLGKCAEALALRKAFPDELSGMYSDEEMGQADNETVIQQRKDGKKPVTQPKRESEKKKDAPPPKDDGTERISGKIEGMKEGREGALFLTVDKKLLAVKGELVDDSMKVGETITVKAKKEYSERLKTDTYFVVSVLENPKEGAAKGEVLDPEPVQNSDPGENQFPEGTAALDGLFEGGEVQKGSDAGPPKTIGPKRAQRLYAIMNQNKKNTGLDEAKLKAVLGKMKKPLEHLSDLEIGLYEMFEKLVAGEISVADVEQVVTK